jgi:hypothetical protein
LGSITIAIDPGDDTGWSKWIDRRLVACGLCQPFEYTELPFVIGMPLTLPDLVIEEPADYGRNRKTDPNKLLVLQRKVGILFGVFAAYYHLLGYRLDPQLVKPYGWKGQLPKEICHDRELPKLDSGEQMILQEAFKTITKSKQHNTKDAVCFGLWRVKR